MALANYIKDKYLYVVVNGKYQPVATSKLSDAQIRDALANGKNAGVKTTEGWVVSNGKLIVDPATLTRAPVGSVAAPAPNRPSATVAPVAPLPAAPVAPPPGGYISGSGTQRPADPAALAAAKPAAPTLNGNAWQSDPQYLMDLMGLRNQLGLVQDAQGNLIHSQAQARLAELNRRIDPTTFQPIAAGGVGGQTLYDILYAKQKQQDARALTSTRSDAAKRGVLSSGYAIQQVADWGSQAAAAADQLVRNYGTDVNDSRSAARQAQQAWDQAVSQYRSSLPTYQASSNQRDLDNRLNQYQQSYGGYS